LPGQGFGGADDLRVVGCVQIVSKGRGYLSQLPSAAARFQRLGVAEEGFIGFCDRVGFLGSDSGCEGWVEDF
jgi:hypothetical protein